MLLCSLIPLSPGKKAERCSSDSLDRCMASTMNIVAATYHENTPRSAGEFDMYTRVKQSYTYAGEQGLSVRRSGMHVF